MTIYNANIPTGLINLDVDYKNIQNNFSQLDTTFGKNHFTYSNATSNNGKHTFVQMVKSAAIPAGLSANEGTLYTKMPAAVTNLYYSPDNTSDEYQMTRTETANFATFGTNTNYPVPVVNQDGGWTFLPGGLLLQYGKMTETAHNTNTGTPVVFPIPFTSFLASLTATRRNNNSNTTYSIISEGLSGFNFVSNGGSNQPFYWMAIGK